MAEGWIKLHRTLLENPIFNNEKFLKVWVWCLLKASHKEHKRQIGRREISLQPGQFIFGRKAAAEELNIAASSIWAYMLLLKKGKNIDIKSSNKFSIISIVNWDFYQHQEEDHDSNADNKWTTDGQQMDTNKNDKNEKNDIKGQDHIPYKQIVDLYHSICISFPKVVQITDNRKTAIRARWKQYNSDMKIFDTLFQKAEASLFLKGNNERKWRAGGFDWFINEQNMAKVLEGKYDNKPEAPNLKPDFDPYEIKRSWE